MPRKIRFYVPKGASRKGKGGGPSEAVQMASVATQTDYSPPTELVLSSVSTQTDYAAEYKDATMQTDSDDDVTVSVQEEREEELRFCAGNSDEKFIPLVVKHKGVFRDVTGILNLFCFINSWFTILATGKHVVAYYDQECLTIRHVDCPKKLPDSWTEKRCCFCKKYRDNVLRSSLSQWHKQQNQGCCATDTSSHVNFRYLATPEKIQRLTNLHKQLRNKDRHLAHLKSKLDKMIEDNGVKVDREMHNDLLAIMDKKPKENDNPFFSVFWQQQVKAFSLKSTRQMKWHPAMIRWALYLHHKSSGCYKTLRNSGIIHLPSERTLCDYKHFAPSEPGFSASNDQQLLEQVKQQHPDNLSKYVTIVLDQMYIKEGLVYNKWSGALIGYADLGEVTNLLDEAEDQAIQDEDYLRPLAKCMLVFMIRGLFTSLKFPYAQFPAVSTKGSSLFPLLRKILARLTRLGLIVLGVVCDGASDNRRMFSLHGCGDKTVHKIVNVYSKESNPIFFFSDPSHLIKTVRNCFFRGKLWVRYILQMYLYGTIIHILF